MHRNGPSRFCERQRTWLMVTAVLLASGCDSGSVPVGPSGTLFTITANPQAISLNGTSIVEVVARDPSGVPVRTGTEVRFTTNLGRIDELARTDGDGVARATLEATGTSGSAVVTATSGISSASVTVSVESRPTADFSCNGSERTVLFADTSSGDPISWRWDFGDGGTSSDKDPAHTYSADGTFVVTLTVRNARGEDSVSKFATVPGTGEVCS